MLLSDLDLKIPDELIAINPVEPRDESSLVVVKEEFRLQKFKNLIDYLNPGDAIVFNNTKVIKGFLSGKINKRNVKINLNKIIDKENVVWSSFIKSRKSVKVNETIDFGNKLKGLIINEFVNNSSKFYHIKFSCSLTEFKKKIKNLGKVPLPPYIIKKREINEKDNTNYQTLFAKKEGAVASPTASLHFTKSLIEKLKKKKVKFIEITLHVNGGTFLPIKTKNITDHKMHSEFGEISKKSANQINRVKKGGGKILAVGTTVLRLLETAKDSNGSIKEFKGETNIFIKPGSNINTIDGIITNFHTPKSTLLLLIFALLGKKKTTKLYKYAIKNKLRFFSYGDACLIWSKNGKF